MKKFFRNIFIYTWHIPFAQPVPANAGKARGVIDPLNGIFDPVNGAAHAYGDIPLNPVIGRPP